jgi:hypothetical protein
MATTSNFDELFANIDAMIEVHVAAIVDHTAQIDALKSARKVLADNAATPAEVKPTRRRRKSTTEDDEPIKMVTEKQLLWLERKGWDGDNPEELTREEASQILDELFNNANEADEAEADETPRQRRTAKATRTRTKRTNGNGNGNGKSDKSLTRKDAILKLHKAGKKPREIAEALEANISYVYLILRQDREAAK